MNRNLILCLLISGFALADIGVSAESKKKKSITARQRKAIQNDKKKKLEGGLDSKDIKILRQHKEHHYDGNQENKKQNFVAALKFIEKMISLSYDAEEIQDLRLEKADIAYLQENFEQAVEDYKEYTKLYPGSKDIDYAKYKLLASKFYLMNLPDRDQTPSAEVAVMAKDYIDDSSLTKYTNEVKKILDQALKSLLEAEVNVFEQNLKSKNYEGAQRRLDYIESKYLSIFPDLKSNFEDLKNSFEQTKKHGKYVQTYKKENESILKRWKNRKKSKF